MLSTILIPLKADLVVPVPDSGVPAALGYAEQSKKKFELGLIRNHYVGRTFIEPTQNIRSLGVKLKLNANVSVIKNKKNAAVNKTVFVRKLMFKFLLSIFILIINYSMNRT